MNHAFSGFRVVLVAVITPSLITLASEIVMLVLAASGPSRIATHWGYAGQANSYGSPFTYPILMAAVAVPLIALLGGGSVLLSHRSPLHPVIKLAAVAGVWMSSLLGVVFIGALLAQRTGASVSHASSPGIEIGIGLVVAFLLGVGAWFVLPPAARRSAASIVSPTPALSLATDERVTWLRNATASRLVLAVFLTLTAILGVTEFLIVWLTDGRAWWVSFVPVLILLFVLSSFAWTVRVDARGVRIRSAMGVPTISIPIDNVIAASVVNVSPIAEFGGYGLRWSLNGRLGVMLRSGTALEIRRRKGMDVVVTVDDAETAAALVNGLVARAQGSAAAA